jgi:hypothetical protein
MSLTNREHELLETIVSFGGFTTRRMVQLRFEFSMQRANVLLLTLVNERYIKVIPAISVAGQSVYQVTFKACKLFGVPHSHMRKKCTLTTLRRNLLRAHFLFQNVKLEDYALVSNSAKRIAYLRSLGVDEGLIPRKINKGDAVHQIEEPFLLLPPFTPANGICIVLMDMIDSDPSRQLRMMVDRYVPLIRTRHVSLSFLVVAENTGRLDEYKYLYDKHILTKDLIKPILNVFSINMKYSFIASDLNLATAFTT